MVYGLKASIIESNKYDDQEKAIDYITNNVMFTPINMDKETGWRKKKEFALEVLKNDLFPHCETKNTKSIFLRIYDKSNITNKFWMETNR